MAERLGRKEVSLALAEDQAAHDITTALLGPAADTPAEGRFIAEESFVAAGLPIVQEVFVQLDPAARFQALVAEGAWVDARGVLATVTASARVLLAGERAALNFLQRLSGIATATRRAVDAVQPHGAVILDTRKTTPGLRALEKYAVLTGGGRSHRASLAEAVLWKDNHWELLAATGGSLGEALARVPQGLSAIVEVETEAQLAEALAAGVRHILIDNQAPEQVATWVRRAGPDVRVEASGGITPETAEAYARAGAHFISIGALTHTIRAARARFVLTSPTAAGSPSATTAGFTGL